MDGTPWIQIFVVAALAVIVGIPFALWQMWKCQKQGKSMIWEGIGLVLCLFPYFIGWGLLHAIERAKDFDSF